MIYNENLLWYEHIVLEFRVPSGYGTARKTIRYIVNGCYGGEELEDLTFRLSVPDALEKEKLIQRLMAIVEKEVGIIAKVRRFKLACSAKERCSWYLILTMSLLK